MAAIIYALQSLQKNINCLKFLQVLTEVVYGLLETEGKLQRVFVPVSATPSLPSCVFYPLYNNLVASHSG